MKRYGRIFISFITINILILFMNGIQGSRWAFCCDTKQPRIWSTQSVKILYNWKDCIHFWDCTFFHYDLHYPSVYLLTGRASRGLSVFLLLFYWIFAFYSHHTFYKSTMSVQVLIYNHLIYHLRLYDDDYSDLYRPKSCYKHMQRVNTK